MLGDKTDVKNQYARGPVCVTMHIVDMGVHLLAHALIRMNMSLCMRKPTMCICENKEADQLCSTADQHLCFHHMDSIIPLVLISEISSF